MACRSKDYQKLIDGRKYAMKYRDAVASLVVLDVVDRDRGLYTCEASNVHGYATSSAALRLKGNSMSVTIGTSGYEGTRPPDFCTGEAVQMSPTFY